jgi:hypothetical protein
MRQVGYFEILAGIAVAGENTAVACGASAEGATQVSPARKGWVSKQAASSAVGAALSLYTHLEFQSACEDFNRARQVLGSKVVLYNLY